MSVPNPTQKTKLASMAAEKRVKSASDPTKDDDSLNRRSTGLATQVDKFVKPKMGNLARSKTEYLRPRVGGEISSRVRIYRGDNDYKLG